MNKTPAGVRRIERIVAFPTSVRIAARAAFAGRPARRTLPRYRLPDAAEHPDPAALDDCLATNRYALDRHGPDMIIIGGRSAGGNLAAATLPRAR